MKDIPKIESIEKIINQNQEQIQVLNNQKQIEKVNQIMKYTNDQLNELPYELALQYDTRKFSQYYLSLLKSKHILFFAIFQNNDYNSRIIKIDLFLNSFTIYYTVNALFFNDDTMHKIYISKGSFDLEYQLPQIIYSSLISMVLNTLLKVLALSNNRIIKFKQDKSKNDIDKEGEELENILKIKFVLYFIISFLLLLFFWYYISMFGVIYNNTQVHLLKDTLISFGLSLIIPFVFYLLPGILRIPALSNVSKKREYLYNFSKFLQSF